MTETSSRPQPGGTFPLAGRPAARVGFGMGELSRRVESGRGSHEDATALLRHARDLSIAHFDTGHIYGDGLANRMLAEVFGGQRDDVAFATKAGVLSDPSVMFVIAQRPHELRAAVEADLSSLRTDRIDLVYLRRMDSDPGPVAEGDQIVPLEDQLAEMIRQRDEGKILGIGLSHVTEAQLRAALPAGIAGVSNIYHVLDRSSEPLLEVCRDNRIPWIPFFPRGGRSEPLGIPAVAGDPVIRGIAERLGATPSQIALAWQLAHCPTTILIPGTGSIAHLDENTASADITLGAEDLRALDEVAAV